MVRSALLLLSLAVVALTLIAGCTPPAPPDDDPNTSDTERTTPPVTPPTDEARTVPAVQAKTGQFVLADQGGNITTATGYDVSLQAGDLTGDAAVAVYEYELDDSARSQGILAAFQVAIPGAEATFANPVTVTVPLERAATPGTKLGVFMMAFPDELGLEASTENNALPIYVWAGEATVSDSGMTATTTVVGANRRFVIAGAAPAGTGASNQKSQNQKHSLPDLTAEQDSDHVNAPMALLLIHGGFGTNDDTSGDTWGDFIEFFRSHSELPNRFFLCRYWYDASLSVADNVDALIARIDQSAKFQQFVIVAHSRGGLVARELMHRAGYADRIALVLTLATPHHGSPFGIPEWTRLSLHGGYQMRELDADWYFCSSHPELCSTALRYRLQLARNWADLPEQLYWLGYTSGRVFGDTPGGRALSWSNTDRALLTAEVMTGAAGSLLNPGWIVAVLRRDGTWQELDPGHIDLDLSRCSPQIACDAVQLAQSLDGADAPYRQRYVCYGAYRDWDSIGGSFTYWLTKTLAIAPSLFGVSQGDIDSAIRAYFQSKDDFYHAFLSLFGHKLQSFLTDNDVTYTANDGVVPLTSALYLDGAPSLAMATVKNAVTKVGDEPHGISGIQVRRCRLFPGLDHLDMVRDPRVFGKIAADLLELVPPPGPNQPPVANGQSVTVAFNTAKAITLTGADPDNGPQTPKYAVVAQPSHGTLSGTAPNVTYTPTTGYSGPDSFTFYVDDGAACSSAATVLISVLAIDEQPAAGALTILDDLAVIYISEQASGHAANTIVRIGKPAAVITNSGAPGSIVTLDSVEIRSQRNGRLLSDIVADPQSPPQYSLVDTSETEEEFRDCTDECSHLRLPQGGRAYFRIRIPNYLQEINAGSPYQVTIRGTTPNSAGDSHVQVVIIFLYLVPTFDQQ